MCLRSPPRRDDTTMPEQSTTLRDMIQEALDSGETYRSLAGRAVDPQTGKTASYGLINNIVLGTTRSAPEPHHLRAIAAALRVPYERARQAAIAQWLPADNEEGMDPELTDAQFLEEAKRKRDLFASVYQDALRRFDEVLEGRVPEEEQRPKSA